MLGRIRIVLTTPRAAGEAGGGGKIEFGARARNRRTHICPGIVGPEK
jgi:hypothetical protein